MDEATATIMTAKEQSALTSNVDSVYSFLVGNQAPEGDVPQVNESNKYIDLRLMNAEINASLHSDGHMNRLKHSILKLNAPQQKVVIHDGKAQKIEQLKPSLLPQESTDTNALLAEEERSKVARRAMGDTTLRP
jgi:hypothetical protein